MQWWCGLHASFRTQFQGAVLHGCFLPTGPPYLWCLMTLRSTITNLPSYRAEVTGLGISHVLEFFFFILSEEIYTDIQFRCGIFPVILLWFPGWNCVYLKLVCGCLCAAAFCLTCNWSHSHQQPSIFVFSIRLCLSCWKFVGKMSFSFHACNCTLTLVSCIDTCQDFMYNLPKDWWCSLEMGSLLSKGLPFVPCFVFTEIVTIVLHVNFMPGASVHKVVVILGSGFFKYMLTKGKESKPRCNNKSNLLKILEQQ